MQVTVAKKNLKGSTIYWLNTNEDEMKWTIPF